MMSKILVKCDNCKKEKNITPYYYNKIIEKEGRYFCSKCKLIEKYGVDNISKIEEVKYKKIQTTLTNYGVMYPAQNNEIKNKMKNTNIEKYGSISPMGNENILRKCKNTNIERYNVENVFQNDEIKKKISKINLNIYGCENPAESEYIKKKIKQSKINNGNQIPENLLSEFKKYRRLVNKYTIKNKKLLFSNWNGNDYYDNEYIKENLKLNKYNPLYPTIDHKISVFYGFVNNIIPEEISKLNNLCITKRYINSKKNKKCEHERKEES